MQDQKGRCHICKKIVSVENGRLVWHGSLATGLRKCEGSRQEIKQER